MFKINELDIHRMDWWLMYGYILYSRDLGKDYVYYWKTSIHTDN
jgi:hypothetical protein